MRIANAAGFLGDRLDAPRQLVQRAEVDYLTLEYLAELTLSILARARQKDAADGFAGDFLTVLESLNTELQAQPRLKIVTNAGGVNPAACAIAASHVLVDAGLGETAVACVTGDDLVERIVELSRSGVDLAHLDTGEPLAGGGRAPVSANAYLGAAPIARALSEGARLVITGRVADVSLTVGPAVHEFGWDWSDWNKLAGATVAGHLIECGAQVTGGYSTNWEEFDLSDVGYPIAEVDAHGDSTITKPAGSGGRVNRESVALQLTYEVGDPRHYLTPDVDADFCSVSARDGGVDRVTVQGARGGPAPADYKVSVAYPAGYTASAELVVYGRDCIAKANECARLVWARLRTAGCEPQCATHELLGSGGAVPGMHAPPADSREVVLRMAVTDPQPEKVARFTKEIAPLITSGPAGLAGYAAPRSPVRPVFAYWPTKVPQELVTPSVEVQTASRWIAR